MEIIRYGGKYPEPTKTLYTLDLLKAYPTQRVVVSPFIDGINIEYRFKRMVPKNIEKNWDLILKAAHEEFKRYFSKYSGITGHVVVEVKLIKPRRPKKDQMTIAYTAAKHSDPDILVYGPGYHTPDTLYLTTILDKIRDIPETYQTRNYRLIKMIVSIRLKTWGAKKE